MPRPSSARRLALLGLLIASAPARGGEPGVTPRTPAEEHATLRLADPGLAITLVAAEPEVVSPVAVAWDEGGAMFVAEMIDYPIGAKSGRVKRLEDRDGDGVYERATVYAEGLPFPNGVLPYKGGVFVTAAPDLWYFKDTDGDGTADERRVMLTGFGEGNPQLRVNGLTWGLDNWVYGADGRSEGEVRRPGDPPAKAVSIRRRDFRFRPTTGEVEAVAGFSQFGLPRDDWGNRFPSWNTVPWRHVVLEERTLARNPYLAEPNSVAEILDPADDNRLFAISPPQTTFNRESVTTFNASCGPTIYRGDLLDVAYHGNAFVCESLTNLVHRRILEPAGPTFIARRADHGREFLASTDPAFRPVNLATGPDGALYVVDFYREMVEHPQFVPEDLRKAVDFRRWKDRGRIWRIGPSNFSSRGRSTIPRLGRAKPEELVSVLGHPNGWTRDTAQRLLVERGDGSAVPALIIAASKAANPLGRLHALATLDGLGALSDEQCSRSLHDPHPGVREAAARLSHGRMGPSRDLIGLADDPSIRVRLQAAIALGDFRGDETIRALAKIAARDADDEWVRLAVLSGLRDSARPFLREVLDANPDWLASPTPGAGWLLGQAASVLGVRGRLDDLNYLTSRLAPDPRGGDDRGRIALLAGLVDGLVRAGKSPQSLLASPSSAERELPRRVGVLLDRARRVVESEAEPSEVRARALRLLARLRPDAAAELIPDLLQPGRSSAIQVVAARSLADVGSPALASRVLGRWAVLGTSTRREVLATVLGLPALATSLLDALEAGSINPAELDPISRGTLERHPDPEFRKRAVALLAKSAPPDRREALRAYQAALTIPGDARRGAEVFAKNCQTCHQRRGVGLRVGPDLSGIAGRPAAALLTDILDPNRDVSPDYVTYSLMTRRGQVLSGLLAEETSTSLRLRRAEGVEEAILRSEVEEFRSTGRSLMPEGLEQTVNVQGIADLLAYLRQP